MFEGRTTPEGIIELVLAEIKRLGGLEKAFPHNGRIQLYSGPDYELWDPLPGESEPIGPTITNEQRALKQAEEWDAVLINHSPIADFLFKQNDLYGWFRKVHDHATSDERDDLIDRDAKAVMSFVSALFIRAASGDVKTAVCGARRDRVFYRTEIPGLCDRNAFPPEAKSFVEELLNNRDIETINGAPIYVFRDLLKKGGPEAVYERICLTELRDRWKAAKEICTWAADDDYLDRLELFRADRIKRRYAETPASERPQALQTLDLPLPQRRAAKERRLRRMTEAKALVLAA